MKYVIFFLCMIAATPWARAEFLHDLNPMVFSNGIKNTPPFKDLSPNETRPQKAKEILKHAGAGIYVAIGAERGFIGASLASNVTHLLLLDIDEQVILFNRINIALLEIAKNRKDYLWLRLKASFSDWQSRFGADEKVERYLLPEIDREGFNFFRRALGEPTFKSLQGSLTGQIKHEFERANYLRDDEQFARLSNLAKAGHIEALVLDLRNFHSVKMVASAILSAHLLISVFDMSNVWQPEYVKHPALLYFIEQFADVSSPRGILLFTNFSNMQPRRRGSIEWDYYAVNLANLRGSREREAFTAMIQTKRSSDWGLTPGKLQQTERLPAVVRAKHEFVKGRVIYGGLFSDEESPLPIVQVFIFTFESLKSSPSHALL